MTEKKPDWIFTLNQNNDPMLIDKLEFFYNPDTKDTTIIFYHQKQQVRQVVMPLQPTQGIYKWNEYYD